MSQDLKIWSSLVQAYGKAEDKKQFLADIDAGFMELAFMFCENYRKNNQNAIDMLNNTQSTMFYMMEAYHLLVRKKKIDKIESLSLEYKREIYEEAKRWSKKQDAKTLVKFSKAIWLIEHLLVVIDNGVKHRNHDKRMPQMPTSKTD